MLTANKGFIPEDLFKAPEYELAKNHNKELPDVEKIATRARYLDSLAPISAIQVFEEIPGIKKSTILLNKKLSLRFGMLFQIGYYFLKI
ncbi:MULTISPECIES: hypothetical protein [Cyanophyceae]|uniref:hypothetical protein n=1 Tax=Cyanophyceae TaxID=3028117 RepID=UPI0016844251|nr:hypothetical protein [Trichocoleus sp. FACHB-40]MBD2003334.1 hypothetical protein [Trichocoleus sp. FACHB-40]